MGMASYTDIGSFTQFFSGVLVKAANIRSMLKSQYSLHSMSSSSLVRQGNETYLGAERIVKRGGELNGWDSGPGLLRTLYSVYELSSTCLSLRRKVSQKIKKRPSWMWYPYISDGSPPLHLCVSTDYAKRIEIREDQLRGITWGYSMHIPSLPGFLQESTIDG